MAPTAKAVGDGWASPPGPDNQDSVKGAGRSGRAAPWKHQLWPGQGVTAT